MLKKYFPYIISVILYIIAITIINLIGIIIYGIVLGGGEIDILKISDLLFFEGGIILTIGAFMEFFKGRGSGMSSRVFLSPYELISKWTVFEMKDYEEMIKYENEIPLGWVLILTGGLMILLSLFFALILMK
ncbi:hypothetical protein CUJ83_12130 [Methanocella sp. CWC-04]|uniref:DUF3899 domain-containing protein n=1 Tax=Methanooceanicella nereidis TaxID=2052831 RepID=A0AAP2REK6_9EURY|nr:hypothetical protein [Methanocella sp. CWC-04]MCD1295747.1 hypothetical protein [Methanocella sp. CWC-04]